jgi:hypothetical protein
MIKQIIMQSQEQAQHTLEAAGITEKTMQEILQYSHCSPPENYFITSQDMVGKAPVWAHFGAWDFDKAHIVNLINKYEQEEAIAAIQHDLTLTQEQAVELYQEATSNDPNNWISPWPSYVSMPGPCIQQEATLYCDAGIVVNLTNGDAQIQTQSGLLYPKQFLFVDSEGNFDIQDFADKHNVLIGEDGRSFSAAIIPVGSGFQGYIMDTELLQSMFTKLFFYNGHGLECFDLFDQRSTVTGEAISVWKVDWECTDPNSVFQHQPSTDEQ